MTERIDQELELLRSVFPNLEYSPAARWVRLRQYRVPPEGGWKATEVEIAFQFLPGYPGQKPYAFHVSPPLELKNGGAIQNVAASSEPPWSGQWQKFSWDVPDWSPAEEVRLGSNMLDFVLTFADRFRQGA
jgi:hypothetical protein